MEAANRQSGVHSLINRDHYYPPSNMMSEREQHSHTSITAPSAISPTTMYPNHPPPPYSQTISAPQSAHPLSGLISPSQSNPPESRRTSGDMKDPGSAHRQSLPSIHEALYPPTAYPGPRNTVDPIPSRNYASYPQHPPTPTSRENSMDMAQYQAQINGQPHRTSPPHPVHHSSYSRPEQSVPPQFETPTRYPPLPSIRTALPTQPVPHPGQSPEFPKQEKDSRGMAPVSNGYSQQHPHSGHHSGHPPSSNSAQPNAYSPQSPYLPQRQYGRYEYGDEHAKTGENPVSQKVYGPVVKRHLDYWDIEIELNNMRTCGNEITRLSSQLLVDAQRNTNHGSMPERMPTLHEIDLIRVQQDKLATAISRVSERVVAQGQFATDQNGPPQGGKVVEEYSQEELSWDEGRNMAGYSGPDAKKRRGRAAPPGRCHSCNRAETPEWRRGPDGARTLCNACGLHYAKLTRKLGSKQTQNGGSSLRPGSVDEVSPRS